MLISLPIFSFSERVSLRHCSPDSLGTSGPMDAEVEAAATRNPVIETRGRGEAGVRGSRALSGLDITPVLEVTPLFP